MGASFGQNVTSSGGIANANLAPVGTGIYEFQGSSSPYRGAGGAGGTIGVYGDPSYNGAWNGTGSTVNSYTGAPATTTSPAATGTTAPAATTTAQEAQQAQPWNINTAASQGMQSSMANTARGQYFNSAQQAPSYMNPFMNQVVGGLAKEAGQNYQMLNNAIGAEATRAGAFGGSRHGVAQGQMAADVQKDLNQQVGNLMYSGYNNAMSQASSDQQMRMNAANQLANLSNLGFGMGRTVNNDMLVQGAMQQALQQQVMDKAAAQYAGYQQSPYTALTAMTTALGQTPYPVTTTTNSTQQASQYKPGAFDYLSLLF